jgi:hypothetical protein
MVRWSEAFAAPMWQIWNPVLPPTSPASFSDSPCIPSASSRPVQRKQIPPEHPGRLEDAQRPRGAVPGPYLSHPALLIDVEMALLPKKELRAPAPAVTHH